MYKKGDFHIHSTASDGNCTPSEVVMLSQRRGVDIIALTDHNTTSGLNEAVKCGNYIGVKVIPGVELSTKYNNTRVHILGYFKDDSYNDELLIKVLNCVKKHKIDSVKKLLHGYLNTYYRRDKLCVENGIEILKFFGANVVLAHPVLLPKNDFDEIIKLNFDGIEAKYFSNTETDTKYFLNIAKEKNIFYTAGSDFHISNEKYRSHGLIGDVYLNSDEISDFITRADLIHI
ncbi:PHP domain-containing protein [uncultured Clostridium sp.]|uniref:PHP domain-containing protein n=1 Tax=uncultured Clostridium sp. TaxID=59620 RepID=UPI0025E51C81|nr:PHP domain-containing protein [uncultured Clostridium sp.]